MGEAAESPALPLRGTLIPLAAVVLVEASLYSALTPLLPGLANAFHLSKTSVGVLFSAYLVGVIGGSWCGALIVARLGSRHSIQLGLALMAVSTVGFGLSRGFATALVSRGLGGVGGGLAWVATLAWVLDVAAPSSRGKTLGTIMSVSIVGSLAGPLIGNAASVLGRLPIFAAVGLACLLCATKLPPSAQAGGPSEGLKEVGNPPQASSRTLRSSIRLLGMTALSYGAMYVLLPLRLATHGVSALGIGWIFVACSALSAIVNRLSGRVIDRRGTGALTFTSQALAIAVLVGLAVADAAWIEIGLAVLAMGIALPLGLTPNSAAVISEAMRLGRSTSQISMTIMLVFSISEVVGGVVAPALASAASDSWALLTLALATFGSIRVPGLGRRR